MINGQLLFLRNTWHKIIAHYSISIQISFQGLGNTSYFEKLQGTCSEILLIIGNTVFSQKSQTSAIMRILRNELINCSQYTSDFVSFIQQRFRSK